MTVTMPHSFRLHLVLTENIFESFDHFKFKTNKKIFRFLSKDNYRLLIIYYSIQI